MRFTCDSSHELSRATGDVQKGALSPILSLSKERSQALWREERTGARQRAENAADALFQHSLKNKGAAWKTVYPTLRSHSPNVGHGPGFEKLLHWSQQTNHPAVS